MYEKMTDEQLAVKAAAGDTSAEEYLIRKYMPDVRSRARLYYIVGGDAEDIVQEGMIGIFKAIHAFDESKGVPFRAFMITCVENQIYTAIEKAGRLKHWALNNSMSLTGDDGLTNPAVENIHSDSKTEPEAHLLFVDMLKDLAENEKKLFSPMELSVWHEYIGGHDYVEIATILGKSPKSIDNALQRIKKKITEHLNC